MLIIAIALYSRMIVQAQVRSSILLEAIFKLDTDLDCDGMFITFTRSESADGSVINIPYCICQVLVNDCLCKSCGKSRILGN